MKSKSLPHCGLGAVLHDVRQDQRQREEEEAQNKISQEAVPLAPGNPRRPERDENPDDDPDNA